MPVNETPLANIPQPPPQKTTAAATTTSLSGWRRLLDASGTNDNASRRSLYFIEREVTRQTGRLALKLRFQDRLKNGEWGAMRNGRWETSSLAEFSDPVDLRLLGLLLSPAHSLGREARLFIEDETLLVDSVLLGAVANALLSSERLFQAPETPAIVRSEKPWTFELEVTEDKNGFYLDGFVKQGRQRLSLKDGLVPLAGGLWLSETSLEKCDWGPHFGLARHLSAHALRVPRQDENELLAKIYSDEPLPDVRVPERLEWPTTTLEPRALIRFEKRDETALIYSSRATLTYDGVEVPPESSQKILPDPVKKRRLKRVPKAERELTQSLQAAFYRQQVEPEKLKAAELPRLISVVLDNGWAVELDGKPVIGLTDVEGDLTHDSGEYRLRARFKFGAEEIAWGVFFESCARGERFLGGVSNNLALVPDEWVTRVDLLLRGAKLEPDGALRFQRAALPLFRPILEEMRGLRIDSEAAEVFAGLQKLLESGSVEKPKELRATLRSYQSEGLAWLERIAKSGFGGILADDMGLGKTIQVIAYLLRRASTPRTGPRASLVVVPKSLVFNWIAEMQKFGPSLRVLDFAGATRGLLRVGDYDVVVTTYHVLKNELDRFEKIEFDSIILDEAQAIKNSGSQVARAVYQLKGAHRFALSGTPVENSLADLFSLLRFVNPGLIPKGLETSFGGRGVRISKEASSRIAVAVRPFLLRRTKKQVLTELPDKTEQVLYCALEGEQKKLYEQMRRQFRESIQKEVAVNGLAKSKMQVLEALLRLRQVCCHPALVEPELGDQLGVKFEVLLEHLEEIKAAGHKALVFSQFTSLLALLKPVLDKNSLRFEYLDGQTRDRGAVVDRFNANPDTTAFLISLKAGGTGLNLTSASYVFLLDPWWNPAIEAQAIDRAYRMGQKQKVMAYRLIAEGTIEEKILRLQNKKRSLADSVITDDPAFLRTLSVEDLAGLFE